MLDFEKLSGLLKQYVEKLQTKVWVCEKVRRRLSCIARAGEDNYSENFIVYEDDKYTIFCEREHSNEDRELVKNVLEEIKFFK